MTPTTFILLCGIAALHASCNNPGKEDPVVKQAIMDMQLKRGELVVCGPPEKEFGTVGFATSCGESVQKDFELGVALLHSFEYDEAEKVFSRIIDAEPGCAMAYWGVAMSNYHPLWAPPTQEELQKGARAMAVAQSLPNKPAREARYIDAIAEFYKDWSTLDHKTRAIAFRNAMEKVYHDFRGDKEASIFYALALTSAADLKDKSYRDQRKAGEILNALYPGQPSHPGIVHYIIHAYDNPALASLALPAARKYASVAPSSAHALHMPSHIFTRLGMWDECIASNKASVSSAQCYAKAAGIKGHWDEELHGIDYLMYAYLQEGQNDLAMEQLNYLNAIGEVHPANFKVAYAFAAVPSRYWLENRNWKEAAQMQLPASNVKWADFPWQQAILHFTRLMGNVRGGSMEAAATEQAELEKIRERLAAARDAYKVSQLDIQLTTARAWMLLRNGKKQEAVRLMQQAADMEDATEKLAVTPGEVLPARELLGDMLLETGRPAEALMAYEESLRIQPNRFNGLYGAAVAAAGSGNGSKASSYFNQLLKVAPSSGRKEITEARNYLDARTAFLH